MTMSFEKYKKAEWKKNPVLAQVQEMKRELDRLRAALDTIETKALPLTAFRASAQLSGMPNQGHIFIHQELKALTGWMDSLVESEIGLHALTMPDLIWTIAYGAARKKFMDEQLLKWHAINTAQTIAMREIALGLYGTSKG
jgi:hypothetical protein